MNKVKDFFATQPTWVKLLAVLGAFVVVGTMLALGVSEPVDANLNL